MRQLRLLINIVLKLHHSPFLINQISSLTYTLQQVNAFDDKEVQSLARQTTKEIRNYARDESNSYRKEIRGGSQDTRDEIKDKSTKEREKVRNKRK